MTLRPNCPVCQRPFPSGQRGAIRQGLEPRDVWTFLLALRVQGLEFPSLPKFFFENLQSCCSGQQLNLDIAMDSQIRRSSPLFAKFAVVSQISEYGSIRDSGWRS